MFIYWDTATDKTTLNCTWTNPCLLEPNSAALPADFSTAVNFCWLLYHSSLLGPVWLPALRTKYCLWFRSIFPRYPCLTTSLCGREDVMKALARGFRLLDDWLEQKSSSKNWDGGLDCIPMRWSWQPRSICWGLIQEGGCRGDSHGRVVLMGDTGELDASRDLSLLEDLLWSSAVSSISNWRPSTCTQTKLLSNWTLFKE